LGGLRCEIGRTFVPDRIFSWINMTCAVDINVMPGFLFSERYFIRGYPNNVPVLFIDSNLVRDQYPAKKRSNVRYATCFPQRWTWESCEGMEVEVVYHSRDQILSSVRWLKLQLWGKTAPTVPRSRGKRDHFFQNHSGNSQRSSYLEGDDVIKKVDCLNGV